MRFIKSYANDAAIQAAVDNKELGKPYVALNEQTGEIDWNTKEETDYSKMYLTIEALGTDSYMLRCWETEKKYSYSINEGEWVEISGAQFISLSVGDTVRLKSTDAPSSLFDGFMPDAGFNVYGNVLSLKYGDNFANIKNDDYMVSFNGSKVVDASNLILPATAVTSYSYSSKFAYCRKLTTAPELPATTLANYSCNSMFYECASLATAPVLPATTLAGSCYMTMFNGCTSLNYIKCLATDISAASCLTDWLSGVSPTGTFVKKAGVTWPTGASGIPSGWTVIEE